MKQLVEIINEELILERVIGFIDDFKFTIDIIPHAEERETRHNKDYISKKEIIYSVAKVAKEIKDDINTNDINIKDRIQIIDKSRGKEFNIICDITKDDKKSNYIKLYITTVMKGKMPTHDIKKIYQTYSSDSKVKDDIKLLKNEI
jgi:hypothetical protein